MLKDRRPPVAFFAAKKGGGGSLRPESISRAAIAKKVHGRGGKTRANTPANLAKAVSDSLAYLMRKGSMLATPPVDAFVGMFVQRQDGSKVPVFASTGGAFVRFFKAHQDEFLTHMAEHGAQRSADDRARETVEALDAHRDVADFNRDAGGAVMRKWLAFLGGGDGKLCLPDGEEALAAWRRDVAWPEDLGWHATPGTRWKDAFAHDDRSYAATVQALVVARAQALGQTAEVPPADVPVRSRMQALEAEMAELRAATTTAAAPADASERPGDAASLLGGVAVAARVTHEVPGLTHAYLDNVVDRAGLPADDPRRQLEDVQTTVLQSELAAADPAAPYVDCYRRASAASPWPFPDLPPGFMAWWEAGGEATYAATEQRHPDLRRAIGHPLSAPDPDPAPPVLAPPRTRGSYTRCGTCVGCSAPDARCHMAPKCGRCEECMCPDRKKPCARRFKLYKPEHAPPCTPATMIGRPGSSKHRPLTSPPTAATPAKRRQAVDASPEVPPRKRPARESAVAGVAAVTKAAAARLPRLPPRPDPEKEGRKMHKVRKLLDARDTAMGGGREYRVEWAPFKKQRFEPTWEPAENLNALNGELMAQKAQLDAMVDARRPAVS